MKNQNVRESWEPCQESKISQCQNYSQTQASVSKGSSLPQQLQGPRFEDAGLFLWSMSCRCAFHIPLWEIVKWIPLIEQWIFKITRILRVLKFHITTEYCLVAKLYSTLCNPMDCSPPGSSVHGISQARILEWFAISFSRGSSRPRDGLNPRLPVSAALRVGSLPTEPPEEPLWSPTRGSSPGNHDCVWK